MGPLIALDWEYMSGRSGVRDTRRFPRRGNRACQWTVATRSPTTFHERTQQSVQCQSWWWTARVGARVLSTRSCQSNSNTSAHEERSRQSRLLRKPELSKEIRLLLHAEPKTPPPAASIGPTAGWSVLPGSFGNGWPWIAGVCRRASSPTHGLTIFPIA